MSAYFGNSASNYFNYAGNMGFSGLRAVITMLWVVRLHASASGSAEYQLGGARDSTGNAAESIVFQGNATASSRRIRYYTGGLENIDANSYNLDQWYFLAYRRPTTSSWNAPIGSRAVPGGSWAHSGEVSFYNFTIDNFTLGAYPVTGNGFYGYCASFQVWNAHLSDGELATELARSSVAPVRTSNLVADYRFANGALTTDSGPNGYTLTANGTITYDADVPSTWAGVSGSLIRRDRRMGGGMGPLLSGGMSA